MPAIYAIVNPARAGMIRTTACDRLHDVGKPRASGDDPHRFLGGVGCVV